MSQTICVQCRNRPAKYQELGRAKNVYCGRICQWEYRLVGLKADGIDDENIIGLESGDGTVRIKITAEQARKMQTIEHVLQAVGHADDYIPLPSVSGRSLSQIKHYLDNGRTLMNPNSMSDTDFVNLLQAADYLHYQHLLLYMVREWSKRDFVGLENMKDLASVAIYFQSGRLAEKLIPFLPEKLRQFYEHESQPSVLWPILLAAKRGDVATLDYFLENSRVDPSMKHNDALIFATAGGHLEVVKRLLQDRRVADNNNGEYSNRPLDNAIFHGYVEMTRYLLKHARLNSDSSILLNAVYRPDSQILDILLQDGRFDPSAKNNRALEIAVRFGSPAAVKSLLLDKRVDPSVIDWNQQKDAVKKIYAEYYLKRKMVNQ